MRKRITKVFSFALAILVLVTAFSVSAFATNEYGFSVTCPKNYDENKLAVFDEDGYFSSYYEEWVTAEDGSEYYTGNTVDLFLDLPISYTELDIEDEYDSARLEWVKESVESWSEITNSNYYYMNFGEFQSVAYDVYYHYHGTDENGKREEYNGLYSEIYVICGAYEITVDIDVQEADDLLAKRNEIVETFADSIEYDAEKMAAMIEEERLVLTIICVVLVVGVVVGIIIFVAVLKSSRKKKQAVYQQSNMNVPPQYYNPYNRIPYGQVPYGNPQGNVSKQATPSYVEPPVTEENKENNTENTDN